MFDWLLSIKNDREREREEKKQVHFSLFGLNNIYVYRTMTFGRIKQKRKLSNSKVDSG